MSKAPGPAIRRLDIPGFHQFQSGLGSCIADVQPVLRVSLCQRYACRIDRDNLNLMRQHFSLFLFQNSLADLKDGYRRVAIHDAQQGHGRQRNGSRRFYLLDR